MAHRESSLVVLIALAANFAIALAKFVAAFFTRSSAMLAEGFHSLADTINQLLLMVGMKLSARPADGRHPFGYAQERYFWAFIVAISIFTVGAVVSGYEGIHKIWNHDQPEQKLQHPWWGIGVLGISILLEGFSWLVAMREFARYKGDRSLRQSIEEVRDPVLITVLFEDSAAMFGLLAALTGLCVAWATGNMLFDGAASVLVGVVLALVAYTLARETKDLLLGESVPEHQSQTIRQTVRSHPGVKSLIVQRTMHLGPDEVLVALKVEFDEGLSTTEIEGTVDGIEQKLREKLPQLQRIWIEPGSSKPVPALPLTPGPLDP